MTAAPPTDGRGCRLEQVPVLVVDCQSTGALGHGHLLELAWARLPAAVASLEVESCLVALPDGERVPRRIRSLTGIEPSDLATAVAPADVWRRFTQALPSGGLVVAHFARFERAYLEALHAQHGDGDAFPVDFLCTHEIACRLLSGLPRRGLRAVAGYCGHVMGGRRRAGAHVRATAVVWAHLAQRLGGVGVDSLAALRSWLEATPAAHRGGRAFSVARTTRLDLPDAPGVYRLLAREGEVLYVGKAISLKRRVNSYFQKRRHDAERTPELLTQVFDVDVTVTASALEAALMEADEIKWRAPPYNLALKPRAPEVWFARDDLAEVASIPDARQRVGPLPDRAGATALAALRSLLDEPSTEAGDGRWSCALGVWASALGDGACLAEGLALFQAQHALADGSRLDARRVRGLGARLWRAHQVRLAERRAARRAEREAVKPAADKEKKPKREWTLEHPGQVVGLLEATVRRCAQRLRRARWFLQLSECALRWRPTSRDAEGPARLLVFGRGRLAHATDAPAGEALLVPTPRSRLARQRVFDAVTYDRMRVLTTELRRLAAAGRGIELCLGPRQTLDRADLARRLYWL